MFTLQALALINDNRIDETIQLLKSVTQDDRFKVDQGGMFNTDVYETIKAAVEKLGTNETKAEFKALDTYLVGEGHISEKVSYGKRKVIEIKIEIILNLQCAFA